MSSAPPGPDWVCMACLTPAESPGECPLDGRRLHPRVLLLGNNERYSFFECGYVVSAAIEPRDEATRRTLLVSYGGGVTLLGAEQSGDVRDGRAIRRFDTGAPRDGSTVVSHRRELWARPAFELPEEIFDGIIALHPAVLFGTGICSVTFVPGAPPTVAVLCLEHDLPALEGLLAMLGPPSGGMSYWWSMRIYEQMLTRDRCFSVRTFGLDGELKSQRRLDQYPLPLDFGRARIQASSDGAFIRVSSAAEGTSWTALVDQVEEDDIIDEPSTGVMRRSRGPSVSLDANTLEEVDRRVRFATRNRVSFDNDEHPNVDGFHGPRWRMRGQQWT